MTIELIQKQIKDLKQKIVTRAIDPLLAARELESLSKQFFDLDVASRKNEELQRNFLN